MFAYGLNTNPTEMASRCPGAVSLGHARLVNHIFRFAIHADVEPIVNSYVDGVLWEINEDHLKALDMLEGYPTYYTRKAASVIQGPRAYHALVYQMQPGQEDAPPSKQYYDTVLEGYRAHNVPTLQLENQLSYHY
jgi:gamma-glutamylcyclotransferase (GGCT)/AIG2-like uncharacterized protein YtfP